MMMILKVAIVRQSYMSVLASRHSRVSLNAHTMSFLDEREIVQKKTFTKWVNSHLVVVNQKIEDLYLDLRDGKHLLKLLEILSGERLPKPTRGKMRIHCLENVDKSLNFLCDQHVHLENVGAHDIVDGNQRLTLGLIWTIILRFQIQDIIVEEYQTSETKCAKDALLLWCQMKTAGYNNVNVRNFSTSWRDGLAFNALIHKHRPDLIEYQKLIKANPIQNLQNAFTVAHDKLGVPPLLEASDVCVEQPDEKSIITYVAAFYHCFNKMKADTVHSKRIGKVVNQALESSQLLDKYEQSTSDLLNWIQKTIELLNDRVFANSLTDVQHQLAGFNTYRTVDKPPKFVEKGDLEVLLFTLQSKMRANNHKVYTPPEGKRIADINRAWENLEKAEHARELALRDELIRQEKLAQLATRFDRKAGMREAWLSENQRLVAQYNFGSDLATVEAATKKHEAIETDISAYAERVNAVVSVAEELQLENYYDNDRIQMRRENVLHLWTNLLQLLRKRRSCLNLSLQLQRVFQEMAYLQDWIDEIGSRLKSEDYGKHLMGVDDLLQKHKLLEADIHVLDDRLNQVLDQAKVFIDCNFPEIVEGYRPAEPEVVQKRGEDLRAAYDELYRLANARRHGLEDSRKMWQFFWDMDDEKEWIKEKSQLMSSPDLGHDLSSVERLLRKHLALEEECGIRQNVFYNAINVGNQLIEEDNRGKEDIRQRIDEMHKLWDQLADSTVDRKKRLLESQKFFQLIADCEDANAWLLDQQRIASNEDVGLKMSTTESLIKINQELMDNLEQYRESIKNLHDTSAEVSEYPDCDSAITSSHLNAVDENYAIAIEMAKQRQQRLLDALSMYKLFDVSDTVRTWITEKRKLLTTLCPSDEIEELGVIRHRFECFEKEMTKNAEKVGSVNKLSENLIGTDHPDAQQIIIRQDTLNTTWNDLADLVEKQKGQLETAYQYNQFLIECQETANWIKEKEHLIESTDELGNDLEGIMQLQRRLSGLQRDLQAIQAKIDHLDEQADVLDAAKPEASEVIRAERKKIHDLWNELKEMLKERDDRLNDSSELQRFLQDLDHFQVWLRKAQVTVASEDVPNTLPEAEKLLQDHEQFKPEIDGYEDDFMRLMAIGRKVVENQTDPLYLFLSERLDGIEDNWVALHKMYEDRDKVLKRDVEAQSFFRDATLMDKLINKQEALITKDVASTPESVEEALRNLNTFQAAMPANDEKISQVIAVGRNLANRGVFPVEKIVAKCDQLEQKRQAVKEKAIEREAKLAQQSRLQGFVQDVDDVEEWISEKAILAQQAPPPCSGVGIAAIYGKFKTFESELDANKDKIEKVIADGEQLMAEQPQLQAEIEPRMEVLRRQWVDLNNQAQEQSAKLADSNREALFDETAKSMLTWITEVSSQIVTTTEEVTEEVGLVELNEQIKDQEKKEQELMAKRKMLDDMANHAEKLKEQYPDRKDEFEQVHQEVRIRLMQLEAPMAKRRDRLLKQKRVRQFFRDLEDEKDWIRDKLALIEDHGRMASSLLINQQLQRRHKMLTNEVDNHEPRVDAVCQQGEKMIAEGHPHSEKFREGIDEVRALWATLRQALADRQAALAQNEIAQQYLFDASEAEAWMGEQELYLMGDEKAKDEQGATNAMKKHELLQKTIENYASEIRSLGDRSRAMVESDHPESEVVAAKQSRVDKMYAGLHDLCLERRLRLEEILKLYSLLREILDLEAWIDERTVIASSHEMGADYEHCCLLRERFADFSKETNELGKHRVAAANELCDALIAQGHGEAAEIASWKDRVNEAWADLLELIETSIQLLKAAWDLHKFLCDCQDVLDRIAEKAGAIPEDVGRDAKAVSVLQRKHAAFEAELSRLGQQVEEVIDFANNLLPSYASEKESIICDRRDEVVQAWRQLQYAAEQRKIHLLDAGDVHRFLAMVRELQLWMDTMRTEMTIKEKPRDVSGVELLMNNHKSLKAEIDAREENFSICLSLGRTLLNRRHPREEEIRDKCIQLVTERVLLLEQWNDRNENLQLMLEVYHFARDAAIAEAWLVAQESFVKSPDLGDSLDETLALLKKHLAFEKAVATQEERFIALQKETMLELKAKERTPESEAARKKAIDQKIAEASREFQPLPSTSQTAAALGSFHGTPLRRGVETPTGRSLRESVDSGRPAPHNLEAVLYRKHEWETAAKRASGRSWHELYFVLNATLGTLSAYKDARSAHDKPGHLYHKEGPVSLAGAVAAPATNYEKRPCVFRLKLLNGGESLFQCPSEDDMHNWVEAINSIAASLPAPVTVMPPTEEEDVEGGLVAPAGRSATLPSTALHLSEPSTSDAQASGPLKPKKKFLTLMRKK
ncbi:spectrin beta chain [Echinococcus multilocularis]|uniref:Spectrin beta chain n=1 Tax=Echinococcus multilocularis TaxID=6211 RepID=A0A068YF82_ECHMU|nr:spectrin beta chain [Echinococcus multilocularis]